MLLRQQLFFSTRMIDFGSSRSRPDSDSAYKPETPQHVKMETMTFVILKGFCVTRRCRDIKSFFFYFHQSFERPFVQSKVRFVQHCGSATCLTTPFELSFQAINVNLDKLLRTFLPKFLLPPSSIIDPNFVPKIALFGPGIESPHTKHLVHKIVNAHTNIFDAEGFVPGLPGGFGSGVRIDFRKSFKFDLMCLYTNSSKVREYQKGVTRWVDEVLKLVDIVYITVQCSESLFRLLAGNNRLLINDVTSDADVLLHDNVLKLLPTLDALAFAVDGSDLEYTESEQAMEYLRSELTIMRDALKEDSAFRHIPILVLLCFNQGSDHVPSTLSLSTLAEGLGLSSETSRSWAIFEVQIANMEGMAKAVDWVVYHTHKRRHLLKYHQAAQSSAGTLF